MGKIIELKTKPTSILWDLIGRLADTTLSIRISGEIGVGKEAIARLLYRHYPLDGAKFVKIDCHELKKRSSYPSIPNIDAMLNSPQGLVLYFDHADCASQEIQTHLLEMFNIQSPSSPPWLLFSSLKPLERCVSDGRFSTRLFKTLDMVHIALPPLRLTPKKIPQMLAWLISHYNSKQPSKSLPMPSVEEMERLVNFQWPRNWRQLQQVTMKAFNRSDWDVPLNDLKPHYDRSDEIDSIAAIYILSMAKLGIQKDNIVEAMVTASDQDKLGLLDLAILDGAVGQLADHIDPKEQDHEL